MATSQLRSTAKDLVQALMKAMGMTVPTTLAGATDKRSIQFWQLATDAGQQLAQDEYKWAILTKEHTITTVIGVSTYDIPTDFGGYVSDSEWNRTTRLPVIGALEEFEWQMLKARLTSGTTFTALFRLTGNQVEFYNTPTSVQTIVLPYTGRGWSLNMDLVTYQDNLINDNDLVLFDPQMFKCKLKLLWYMAKQFNTTKVEAEFNRARNAAKANDSPGRTLSLAKGSDYPYLGIINLPDTGYGS